MQGPERNHVVSAVAVLLMVLGSFGCSKSTSADADTNAPPISDVVIGPTPGSCINVCGRSSREASCGCDFQCQIWGDCCPDFLVYCADMAPPSEECSFDVDCTDEPTECAAPLVALNKGGCWGCGYPITCTCSDGTNATCNSQIPVCNEGQELAVQEGCYACVDPINCVGQEVEPYEQCTGNEQCAVSVYESLVTGEADCYCLGCPSYPMTKARHDSREGAWKEWCAAWSESAGCTVTGCAEMDEPSCADGICAAAVIEPAQCLANPPCDTEAPTCPEPLVPLQKGDCWGCGMVDTCSCSDGSDLTCETEPPACQSGVELAVIEGCETCVDPVTCTEDGLAKPLFCESGDGWYCGKSLGMDEGTLYLCLDDGVTVLEVCEHGCVAVGAGQPDQCADATPGEPGEPGE